MSTTFTAPVCGTPAAVAERVRGMRVTRDDAERQILFQATVWADLHPGEPPAKGELDEVSGVPLEEISRPTVAWDAGAGFAGVLGTRTGAGEVFLDEALEVRHRLPRVWERVLAGEVEAWRARRIAQFTLHEPDEVVAAIDDQVAEVAERIGVVTLDRILTETVLRHDPERSEEQRHAAMASRYVRVLERCNAAGVAELLVRADAKDVHDLDQIISDLAAMLAASPDWAPEPVPCRDVLRSIAVGILADPARALAILNGEPDPARTPRPTRATSVSDSSADPDESVDREAQACAGKGTDSDAEAPADTEAPTDVDRDPSAAGSQDHSASAAADARASRPPWRARKRLELVVHLSEDAITTSPAGSAHVGRVDLNGGLPVLADTIREWCSRPDTAVTIRPVIDTAGHEQVDAYEIPQRIKNRTDARDHTCVFAYCTRPATRCDHDHTIPHAQGGSTCECNLAPLCRRHHRLKTHAGWTYTILEPGAYLWCSPHGDRYFRDNQGTGNITPQIRPKHDGCFHPPDP